VKTETTAPAIIALGFWIRGIALLLFDPAAGETDVVGTDELPDSPDEDVLRVLCPSDDPA
jgi:hypothetical protein